MKKRKSAAIEVAVASIGLISPACRNHVASSCREQLGNVERKENFCGILRHERDGEHAIELFGFPTRTNAGAGRRSTTTSRISSSSSATRLLGDHRQSRRCRVDARLHLRLLPVEGNIVTV